MFQLDCSMLLHNSCCFLVLMCLVASLEGGDLGAGTVWPLPNSLHSTGDVYYLTLETRFFSHQPKCFLLQDALVRAKRNILSHSLFSDESLSSKPRSVSEQVLFYMSMEEKASSLSYLSTVEVNVKQTCDETQKLMRPSYDMDESYSISFSGPTVTLQANQVWGALHALETLSQLAYRFNDGSWRVNGTTVKDYPAFKHRGTLLDTSRHFIEKKFLLRHLEAMSYNKMNVFHWHIVDDPSFPYESYTYPELSQQGAYRVDSFHVYSQQDIADVIEYARRRGIRVIPEFDTPGHTLSWGKGQSDLLTPCYGKDGKPSGTYGPIDPSRNSSYTFLGNLFGEVTRVFPDSYVHLGGDEVDFTCWRSNPNITAFMKKQGMGSDYSKLEQFYEQTLINLVSKVSPSQKRFVVWQEIVDNQVVVPSETLIHVWMGGDHYPPELEKVTAKGYEALLSSCWYLDWVSIQDWDKYYLCDPLAFNGTAEQKKLVVGGEACLWGEFVDSSVSVSRFWPRGSSVAERLWSKKDDWTPSAARGRFEGQRCRMLSRGLQVEPAAGPGYCSFGQPYNRF